MSVNVRLPTLQMAVLGSVLQPPVQQLQQDGIC